MSILTQLLKISKKIKRVESAGLFLPLPAEIAKFFPKKEEDTSPPHITVLYFGKVLAADKNAYKQVIEIALEKTKIGKVYLDDLSFFKNEENKWIAHNPVRCEGLADFRKKIWDACKILDLEIHDSYPKYKPHATLAYLDEKKYSKDIFVGSFKPTKFEIWGFDQKISIPLPR